MTRTERVIEAFRLLVERGSITAAELAEVSGAPVKSCTADLALMGRFVPLERIRSGRVIRWRLPVSE